MNLKDLDHLDDIEADGKTILKLSLHKQDGNMLVGFVLLRIRLGVQLLASQGREML